MVNIVKRYIGVNGDILIPVPESNDNTSNLVSLKGVYYLAQTEAVPIEQGNPMGLLLTLTYPDTP